MMTGSIFNRLYEGKQSGELYVGMGATEMLYSDRHAYTVQRVVSDKRVIVTRDKAERIDGNGASDSQEWSFKSVPLVDGKREKTCCHPFAFIINDAGGKEQACKQYMEHGTCEGCPFYKMHKPSNGIVLIKTKRGWKRQGKGTYFALGVRDEFYDYAF